MTSCSASVSLEGLRQEGIGATSDVGGDWT